MDQAQAMKEAEAAISKVEEVIVKDANVKAVEAAEEAITKVEEVIAKVAPSQPGATEGQPSQVPSSQAETQEKAAAVHADELTVTAGAQAMKEAAEAITKVEEVIVEDARVKAMEAAEDAIAKVEEVITKVTPSQPEATEGQSLQVAPQSQDDGASQVPSSQAETQEKTAAVHEARRVEARRLVPYFAAADELTVTAGIPSA
ncbi:hypothetical protein FOA52_002759 [Chlamydomonas sp. UWO 241]|nr:hypothetical protein FOA52_002759 [Chlamydomonas sp. UWO 241]